MKNNHLIKHVDILCLTIMPDRFHMTWVVVAVAQNICFMYLPQTKKNCQNKVKLLKTPQVLESVATLFNYKNFYYAAWELNDIELDYHDHYYDRHLYYDYLLNNDALTLHDSFLLDLV